jgi:hypothetical protein
MNPPDTIFVAHGPGWWAEISGDVKPEDRDRYPKGKIEREGKSSVFTYQTIQIFMQTLSARSAYNALTRDP